MEHAMEHREHAAAGDGAVRNRLDSGVAGGVTGRSGAPGARHPECGSHSPGSGEIKFGHGGPRPGAGRPRKPASVALLAPGAAGLRWYVAAVERGSDVERRLGDAGFACVVPRYRTAQDVLAEAFPGYAIVEFDLRGDQRWRIIPQIRGVRRLIGSHPERPLAVPPIQAAWVIGQFGPDGAQCRPMAPVVREPLAVGSLVRVSAGLGIGWAGVVEASDGRSVWLRVGGRTVRVAQAGVEVCDGAVAKPAAGLGKYGRQDRAGGA